MSKLLCIGDNVADYYPEKQMLYPGGSAFNVAVMARRFGLETAYIGVLGSDQAGSLQRKVLDKEGVNSTHTSIVKGKNAVSQIINIEGVSKVTKVNKGVSKDFCLSKKDFKFIKQFKYIHTNIYSYTERYLSEFKKMGINISFDFSFKRDYEYLKEIAPYIDIAFFSAEEIKEDIKEIMLSISNRGPEYIIATLGSRGVLALYKGNFYYQPALKTNVVDTLGAGDTFIAMFLSCLLKGLPLTEILKLSNEKAADSCGRFGAIGWGIMSTPENI